jgi:hypothetical protein
VRTLNDVVQAVHQRNLESADLSLTAVDTRFPRYWRGLGVAAGGDATATFAIAVPAGIAPGVYFGNCYLVRRDSFDVGHLFDRSCFDMTRVVAERGASARRIGADASSAIPPAAATGTGSTTSRRSKPSVTAIRAAPSSGLGKANG